MNTQRFPEIIRSIYKLVEELEEMFPGRHFTPDGHMVGSLGEAFASYYYGVNLMAASTKGYDGVVNNRKVQIKATQTDRISISSNPDQLMVLQLKNDGSFAEIYNGPGDLVWRLVSGKKLPKNGQYQIALSKLKKIMQSLDRNHNIAKICEK